MTADEVLKALMKIGAIDWIKIKPPIRPKLMCKCFCKECGQFREFCVCQDNAIIKTIRELEDKKQP